jgi:hypothetical protein
VNVVDSGSSIFGNDMLMIILPPPVIDWLANWMMFRV